MSRIGDLFKGSQVFRNQQLGHFLLHYSPLTHALLKTEYGPNSLPRRLNLSIDTCWRLWERVSRVSEGDLSFHTVSRRHGSDWEPCNLRGKSFSGAGEDCRTLGWASSGPSTGWLSKVPICSLLEKEGRERHGCVAIVPTYLSLQNAVTEIFLNGNTSTSLVSKNLGGFCFSPLPVLGCFFY